MFETHIHLGSYVFETHIHLGSYVFETHIHFYFIKKLHDWSLLWSSFGICQGPVRELPKICKESVRHLAEIIDMTGIYQRSAGGSDRSSRDMVGIWWGSGRDLVGMW